MKKVIVLAAIALSLSGCGEFSTSFSGPKEVKLPDGRTVICVLGESGSVDCDFDHAK